jgi:peptidoglycan hydrolase CwlO-like protein
MKNFLSTTLKVLIVLAIAYLVYSSFTGISINQDYKKSIDSLNTHIQSLEKKQDSLNKDIEGYQTKIDGIDSSINTIKTQKNTVKEYYHEKIIAIDNFNHYDIDTFFARRYGL